MNDRLLFTLGFVVALLIITLGFGWGFAMVAQDNVAPLAWKVFGFSCLGAGYIILTGFLVWSHLGRKAK